MGIADPEQRRLLLCSLHVDSKLYTPISLYADMGEIACYFRVSTENQNLDRQIERTAEDYHDVVAILDEVAKDDLSKRKAARRLDTSRPTINRALQRGELYGL